MASGTTTPSGFVDIRCHYDGQYHFSKGNRYLNPTIEAATNPAALPASERVYHRDLLGRITHKPRDLARYISPTQGKPFRLSVQATYEASRSPQGEWRRVSLHGHGRILLRLAIWAVGDVGQSLPLEPVSIAGMILKVLLIAPVQVILLPFASRGEVRVRSMYPSFSSQTWDYPKYARNKFDACPIIRKEVTWAKTGDELATYNIIGEQSRLLRPRKMVILKNKEWKLCDGTDQPYIVISYTSQHFKSDTTPERLARVLALEAGVKAYWVDRECRAQTQPGLTDDVHRICDVFRGARQVCVVLPDLRLETKQFWGTRMWCLPEALLSSQQKLKFCSPAHTEEWTKLDLAARIWTDGEPTRLLAEHYTGLLTLSRLELISIGLEALLSRWNPGDQWTQGDVAYALMSLLHYRPRMNPEDNLFQALGRLSLANDSDRIMERRVCMLPDVTKTHHSAFVLEDTLGAKLWDIEPLCQVAGVGNGNEIILDGCHAASIRWKDIPRIQFVAQRTWKKRFGSLAMRSTPIWLIIGFALLAGNQPLCVLFILIGLCIVLASPWIVQILYGGKVRDATPWLIGFEGTLPLRQVERITFGNCIGRLRYAPSSSVFCEREFDERMGKEPTWIAHPSPDNKPELPRGHRFFTLIDTGPSMMVHVFSAARPPSVALICGREGGMLRVVLCSYERSTNCLHKETVLRMETPMLDLTCMQGWVKIA